MTLACKTAYGALAHHIMHFSKVVIPASKGLTVMTTMKMNACCYPYQASNKKPPHSYGAHKVFLAFTLGMYGLPVTAVVITATACFLALCGIS